MAKTKKQEQINELDNAGNSTAALETLQPGSRPDDDPKTKFEWFARVIQAFAQVDKNDLNKFGATLAQIGHEADPIPGDDAAKNAASIAMKPSDAVKESIKADIETLLAGGEGLTEEFKLKATTLFEAALNAQVTLKEMELQEEFEKQLDEAVTEIVNEVAGDVESYIEHTAQTWLKENEVAVESALRNNIYDNFITNLKTVFEDSFITIPEEKIDVVETLSEKVDELESSLSEAITENADLRKAVATNSRKEIVDKICEGLTLNEATKLRELADGVESDDVETFKKKVEIIKESSFVKPSTGAKVLTETLEEVNEDNKSEPENTVPPEMQKYVNALTRTSRK